MKKILALTIILLVLSFSLFGCSSPIQESLQSKWQNYEKYIYDMEYQEESIGTLTLISERINSSDSFTIGDKEYQDQIGTKVSYQLIINDTTDYIEAEVFFKTNFNALYSYKKIIDNDSETIINANYTDKKCNYKVVADGDIIEDSISTKVPTYDNEMVYYVIRCVDMSSDFTFNFNVPSPIDNVLQSRTAALSDNTEVNVMGEVRACYEVSMNTEQRMRGDNFLLYYSSQPIIVDDESLSDEENFVPHPLVKIVEGDYTYTLQYVTTNPIQID